MFAYASNPNVSRYMPWDTHRTLADSLAFVESILTRHDHEHTWAIGEGGGQNVIGAIEFGLKADTIAQLDYLLAETHWRRGLMSEAARAVITWGLARYPMVRRIVACAHADNVASHRLLEGCGFHFERAFRDHWPKFEHPIEQRQYVLTRDRSSVH